MASRKGSVPSEKGNLEQLQVQDDASRYMVKSGVTQRRSFYAQHKKWIVWGAVVLALLGVFLLILGLR